MSTMIETVKTMSAPKSDKKIKVSLKKVIILKLSSDLLAQFLPKSEITKDAIVKSDPESTSAPATTVNGDTQTNGTPADNVSESPSTPAPSGDLANGDASKKKGGPGSRGGVKRGLSEASRPRGRPGPKKKAKLDDGSSDPAVRTSFGGAVPLNSHKLGPRANQGAINAGLRALDRSGKPCRKWEKKSFQLKSFTGVAWELPSWKAPVRQDLTNGEANGTSGTGESESKPNESSTGVQSEKSNQGEQVQQNGIPNGLSTPAASSPPPIAPAIAIES